MEYYWLVQTLGTEILSAILGSVITIIFVIKYEPAARKHLLKTRFFPVVGISSNSKYDTYIIVPSEEGIMEDVDPKVASIKKLRNHVRVEDMLAVNLIARTLNLAGVSEDKIHVYTVTDFEDRLAADGDLKQNNLILIGASHKNPFVGEALLNLNTGKSPGEQIKFEREREDERIKLKHLGSSFPDEALTKSTDKNNEIPYKAEDQFDIGFILKSDNPFSVSDDLTTLIIVAGTRGFGTWGAAKTLRESDKTIRKHKLKNKNYTLISAVTTRGTGLQINTKINVAKEFD